MEKLAFHLIRRYGMPTLIAVVVFLTLLLWGIPHYLAKPGSQVRVLWGAAEYTKDGKPEADPSDPSPSNQAPAAKVPTPPTKSAALLLPTQISSRPYLVASGVTQKTLPKTLEDLRKSRQLRKMSTLESGRGLQAMPIGTYGFIANFTVEPAGGALYGGSTVSRINNWPKHLFEVHRVASGEFWIAGFVAPSESAKVLSDGKASAEATLFPLPWEDARDLIVIPVSQFSDGNVRRLQLSAEDDLSAFDVTIGGTPPRDERYLSK